jgi:hypothetical protein
VEVTETKSNYVVRLSQETRSSEQLHELCDISKKELEVPYICIPKHTTIESTYCIINVICVLDDA